MRSFERFRLGTIHPVERIATEIDPSIQVQLRATFARAIRWRWMGQALQLPLVALTIGGGYLLYDHLNAVELLGLAIMAAALFAWTLTRPLACPSCQNEIDVQVVRFCPQCGNRFEAVGAKFDHGTCARCGPIDLRHPDPDPETPGVVLVVHRGTLILKRSPHIVRHCTHCGLMLTEVTEKKP